MSEISLEALRAEMQSAMKAGHKLRLVAIKGLMAALKTAEVAKGGALDAQGTLKVIEKEAKSLADSAEDFEKAARLDRAQELRSQVEVIREWLPDPMSDDELELLVEEAIAKSGAAGPKQMGQVMAELMPKVTGRVDGKTVSALVKKKLS